MDLNGCTPTTRHAQMLLMCILHSSFPSRLHKEKILGKTIKIYLNDLNIKGIFKDLLYFFIDILNNRLNIFRCLYLLK